jgi:DNA-binding NtrC family response regulator
MLFRALIAAESQTLRWRIRSILEQSGVLVSEAETADRLWQQLAVQPPDLVIASETLLPSPIETSIAQLRALPDRAEVIMLSSREDPEGRAALQAAGCFATVSSTLADASMHEALRTLVERHRDAALNELRAEQEQRPSAFTDFSARSATMQELLRLARKVTRADTSLLILGETGVGKEWLARSIHSASRRSRSPFIAVNCAAVPESLLESELFGHEKGSFTGAIKARRGLFELAHEGTLFLDEIGDLPFHLQVKLLRVLQEKSVRRIGSEEDLTVDVRLMAATNQDLALAIAEKRFRQDLFYRLSVMTLEVPPLRHRREDVAPLVETYLERFRVELGRTDVEGLTEEALVTLEAYAWPGNVRELINVLERAVLLCEGSLITLDDLPQSITASAPADAARAEPARGMEVDLAAWIDLPLERGRDELVERFERMYLEEHLEDTAGNVSETAQRAGIDPRTLYNKMRAYGLRKEDFKRRSRA